MHRTQATPRPAHHPAHQRHIENRNRPAAKASPGALALAARPA
ncbi:hypothetical protein [Sphingomonas sp. IC081]|nr:hypothetical protein [Sphingomonas sp. IC081]